MTYQLLGQKKTRLLYTWRILGSDKPIGVRAVQNGPVEAVHANPENPGEKLEAADAAAERICNTDSRG